MSNEFLKQATPNTVLTNLEKGKNFYKQLRYSDALIEFDKALEQDPLNIDALTDKAKILIDLEKYSTAREIIESILHRSPNHGKANYIYAVLLDATYQPVSEQHYIKGIEFASNDADAYIRYALHQRSLGEYDKALELCAKARDLDNQNIDAYITEAYILATIHRPDEALVRLDTALTINPLAAKVLCLKGRICMELKRYAEAYEYFTKAVALAYECGDIYQRAAKAYDEVEQYENAAEILRQGLTHTDASAEMYLNYAYLRSILSDKEDCSHYIATALSLESASHEEYLLAARLYSMLGLAQESCQAALHAIELCDEAIKYTPNNRTLYTSKMAATKLANKCEDLDKIYAKILELDFVNSSSYVRTAEAMVTAGDILADENPALSAQSYQRELEMYECGIEKYSNDPVLYFECGKSLLEYGEFKDSIKQFQKAIKLGMNSSELYEKYGIALFQTDNHPLATKFLKKAISINYHNIGAHLYQAYTLVKLDKKDEALVEIVKTQALNSVINNKIINQSCNDIASKLLSPLEALKASQVHIDEMLETCKITIWATQCRDEAFNSGKSIVTHIYNLSKSPSAFKSLALAYSARAEIFIRAKEYDLAIDSAKKALLYNAKDANAFAQMGFAYFKQEKYYYAKEAFTKAISYNILNTKVYSNVSTLFLQEKKYDEALKAAEQALEFNPNNVVAHLNSGTALKAMGYVEEAMQSYSEVHRLRPDIILTQIIGEASE